MREAKGPIFEDGPNFDVAFKLFHGKDGVVPLSSKSNFQDNILESEPAPQFNPLAAKAATISLSAFGLGGPFGFGSFNDKWKKQKRNSESNKKKESSSQVDAPSFFERGDLILTGGGILNPNSRTRKEKKNGCMGWHLLICLGPVLP